VSKLQPVRGTHDLLPDEYRRFAHVIDTARDVARLYGYREMATPIFEFTELFARGIGETTSVVSPMPRANSSVNSKMGVAISR